MRMVLALFVLFGQPLVAHASPTPSAVRVLPVPTSDALTPDAHGSTETLQGLQEKTDNVLKTIQSIRSSAPLTSVAVAARSDEELRAYLLARMEKDDARTHLQHTGTLLTLLGVLNKQDNLEEMVLHLLLDEVAGYYEPDDKQLYVRAHHLDDIDETVLAHELQHAMQDATWDLTALIRPSWRQQDVQAARSALVEGDATLMMLAYHAGRYLDTLPKGTMKLLTDAMRSSMHARRRVVPEYLLNDLLFPYVNGLLFVYALVEQGGWAAVDAAFERPPLSTAQILYPERYLRDERPILLSFDLPSTLVGERLETTVLGLASTRYLFEDIVGGRVKKQQIEDATIGWKGDRIELWQGPQSTTMVWLSLQEDVTHAQRYYELARKALPLWAGSDAPTCVQGRYGQRCGAIHDGRGALIERWGEMVLVVIDERPKQKKSQERNMLAIAEHVFSTLRASGYPDRWLGR